MSVCTLLFDLYKVDNLRFRKMILSLVNRLDGGEYYSTTLRKIFSHYHKVDVGMYSRGGCFIPNKVQPYTTIGRYTGIGLTARIWNRNHPPNFKSTHAFFYNPGLGYCDREIVDFIPTVVGNDVWVGDNAIILPRVRSIGDGAIVGAGAVVTRDVPPYAIVAGNPARIVKYRFSPETIETLLKSRWWDKEIWELKDEIESFRKPLE